MFDVVTLLTFLLASGAIIAAPGPAQALVLARTLAEGRRAGIQTAVGLNVGTLVHAVAAGLGVSAVLATSALAFNSVKYAGAAYLVYLGVQSWRQGERHEAPPAVPSHRDVTRAVITGILNPKVALFFLAFLPQFVDPTRASVMAQFIALGAIIACMDIVYECALVWLAAKLGPKLRSVRFQRWQHRGTGAVLVGLGARLAFVERR